MLLQGFRVVRHSLTIRQATTLITLPQVGVGAHRLLERLGCLIQLSELFRGQLQVSCLGTTGSGQARGLWAVPSCLPRVDVA